MPGKTLAALVVALIATVVIAGLSRQAGQSGATGVQALDHSSGHVVLFGGAATSETWSFGYDGELTPEVCSSGHDIDGDQLIGCGDPDCWWLCSPACVRRVPRAIRRPLAAAMACARSSRRAGRYGITL